MVTRKRTDGSMLNVMSKNSAKQPYGPDADLYEQKVAKQSYGPNADLQ